MQTWLVSRREEGGADGGLINDRGSHHKSCMWLGLENKSILVKVEERSWFLLNTLCPRLKATFDVLNIKPKQFVPN